MSELREHCVGGDEGPSAVNYFQRKHPNFAIVSGSLRQPSIYLRHQLEKWLLNEHPHLHSYGLDRFHSEWQDGKSFGEAAAQ